MKPKTHEPAPAEPRPELYEQGFFEDLFAAFNDSLNLLHLHLALYGPAQAPRHTEPSSREEAAGTKPAPPPLARTTTAGQGVPQPVRAPRRATAAREAHPRQRRA